MNNFQLPNQYVSDSKKQDYKFNQETIDYYINLATSNNSYREYISLITNAINGKLTPEQYSYVLNPYNSDDPRLKNFPSRLRNYDIISPIIRRYLGEYITSVKNFVVVNKNPSKNGILKRKLDEKLKENLVKMFINNLIDLGIEKELEKQEIQEYDEIIKDVTYDDTIVEENQSILDYIYNKLNCDILYAKAWYYWITYGIVITKKYIENDDIKYEVINPEEYYPVDNGEDFIENNECGVHVFEMNIDDVIYKFKDELSKEDYNYLLEVAKGNNKDFLIRVNAAFKNRNLTLGYDFGDMHLTDSSSIYSIVKSSERKIKVYHVVYISPKKIKILKYFNKFGEELEKEVPDDYQLDELNGDIRIDEVYIPEVREAYRIGEQREGVYILSKPISHQLHILNSRNKPVLPFNGKLGMFNKAPNHSLVYTLIPYQAIYNIYHLQREREINKWIGSFVTIPKGLLQQDDISKEAALYYLKADGKIYLDETDPSYKDILEGIRAYSVNSYDYIRGMGVILEEIKSEAWEAVDMNRQRYGETKTSDGKYVTQEAIARVSMGTVPIIEFFNNFVERELQGLLELSKFAWLNKDYIVDNYINSEKVISSIKIDVYKHLFTDYGVYVKNYFREQEKIQQFKAWAFNISQNGYPDLAAEAIDSNNPTRLKNIIKKAVELNKQREEQLALAKEQLNLQAEQIKSQNDNAERQVKLMIENAKIQKDIYLKQLELGAKNVEEPTSLVDASNIQSEIDYKREKLNLDREKLQVAKDKLATEERIAKINKNKYDKQ